MPSLADLLATARSAAGLQLPEPPRLGEDGPSTLDSLLRPYSAVLGGGRGGLDPLVRLPVNPLNPWASLLGGKGPGSAPGFPGSLGLGSGPTPYSGPYSFQPVATGRVPVVDRSPDPLSNPGVVTPEIQRVASELWSRWPSTRNLGTHVVKNIAGTNTLSQHSFGNAIDIGGDDAQLTEQASWLARHAPDLGISQVIFKDRIWTDTEGWHAYTGGGHDTHVHVTGPQTYGDTSPQFREVSWNTPTPAGQPRPRRRRRGATSQQLA